MKERVVSDKLGLTGKNYKPLRLLCWLKTIYRSVLSSEIILGHDYVVTTPWTKAEVEVLTCEDCGHHSIGWVRLEDDRTLKERYKDV